MATRDVTLRHRGAIPPLPNSTGARSLYTRASRRQLLTTQIFSKIFVPFLCTFWDPGALALYFPIPPFPLRIHIFFPTFHLFFTSFFKVTSSIYIQV